MRSLNQMFFAETVSLSALHQNITIAFCKESQFDYFNDQGYPGTIDYFGGQVDGNTSILTWQGVEGNTNFTQIFDKLYRSNNEAIPLHLNRSAETNNRYG